MNEEKLYRVGMVGDQDALNSLAVLFGSYSVESDEDFGDGWLVSKFLLTPGALDRLKKAARLVSVILYIKEVEE